MDVGQVLRCNLPPHPHRCLSGTIGVQSRCLHIRKRSPASVTLGFRSPNVYAGANPHGWVIHQPPQCVNVLVGPAVPDIFSRASTLCGTADLIGCPSEYGASGSLSAELESAYLCWPQTPSFPPMLSRNGAKVSNPGILGPRVIRWTCLVSPRHVPMPADHRIRV